jgi:hypothetical protein
MRARSKIDRKAMCGNGFVRRFMWPIFALLGALVTPLAMAHGGLSMDQDKCVLKVGPYFMHFAGYQPGSSGATEFCEDIPAAGQTVVTIDAIDDVLRTMPLQVRIVRDTGAPPAEPPREADTVLYVPPKLYPAGSVSFEYQFEGPGQFVGYVMAGEKGQYVARFPFSVGRKQSVWSSLMPYAGLGVLALLLLVYTGRRRKSSIDSSDK